MLLIDDVRHGYRRLRSQPSVTLGAVMMLGLAVGIASAMFAVVDALLLRPVPFHAPDQLSFIYMGTERGGRATVAPAVLEAWRGSQAFVGVESADPDVALIELGDSLATRGMAWITPGLFDLLGGVKPIRGRLFDASEGRAGLEDRVVLSERVWRALYHADPALVGQRVTINGESLLVVGILPAEFSFPAGDTAVWRPVDFNSLPPTLKGRRPRTYVRFVTNLPRADALRIATDAARLADGTNAGLRPRLQPLAGLRLEAYYQRAVPLLAGGVVMVFLVLCANVSSLLLTRLTARRRELGICAALGASHGRLIRQTLVESSIIGVLGIATGVGLAWVLVSMARALLPDALLLRTLNPLNLDLRALSAASVAGVFATLASGLLPAWIGAHVAPLYSLRVADRGGTETRSARAIRCGLLMAEIALACTLLIGATLLVRSFLNLSHADRGLDVSGVITATVSLPARAFPDQPSRVAAAQLLEEQVRQLPGVNRVAWSYGLPPDGSALSFGKWESDAVGVPAVDMTVQRYSVGPEFLDLYRIPLLRGRIFQTTDTDREVLVGERLARTLWPGLDPVGRTFRFGKEQFSVIGLVGEINHPSLDAGMDRPEFYQPFGGLGSQAMMTVRCGDACPGAGTVRKRLVAAHPGVRVLDVRRLEDVYVEQLAQPRAAAALTVAFAAITLLAAAGGLFSVLSYTVGYRRREFGIRTALGASSTHIGRLALRDGVLVAVGGLALGVVAAWTLAEIMASLQYGVTVNDPVSWALVVGLICLVTLAASWRPVREAMRVDPVRLLREE